MERAQRGGREHFAEEITLGLVCAFTVNSLLGFGQLTWNFTYE
jgi:hypothetical protein